MQNILRLTALCSTLLLAAPVLAAPSSTEVASKLLSLRDEHLISSRAFQETHPDHRWRAEATSEYDRGAFADALAHFRKSARYADKLSQAMIGEMTWNGQGTAVDRALGYAWMDLAAERQYPMLLGKREWYWQQMSEAERARAVAVGRELYAEFGDQVAKPRLEAALAHQLRHKTGTRLGADNGVRVYTGGDGWKFTVTGGNELVGFYDSKFWQPQRYWAWQDATFGTMPRGRTVVHEIVHQVDYKLSHD